MEMEKYLNENCSICRSPLIAGSDEDNEALEKTECGHMFHENCLRTWLTSGVPGNYCPLCKTPMPRGADAAELPSASSTVASSDSDSSDGSSLRYLIEVVMIRRLLDNVEEHIRRLSSQPLESPEGEEVNLPVAPVVSGEEEEGMDSAIQPVVVDLAPVDFSASTSDVDGIVDPRQLVDSDSVEGQDSAGYDGDDEEMDY